MPSLPSGTVTFLFTDIEGSTRLWEQHPRAMQLALAQHHSLLRQAIEAHSGQVFQIIGDAFCAAFPTAPAALQATLAAQRLLRDAAWDVTGPIRVRMALHTAAVDLHDGEYPSGQHFNRIARILHLGHGGQVLFSLATEQLVRDHLPPDTALRDLGQGGLRGLTRAEHVFQLVAPDLPADFPALKDFDPGYRETAPSDASPLPNPYKGLRAFHEADAPDFFGREALTERLLARLAEDVPFARFLAVVGPSGSGKSSVVRAGLVPALRQGRLPGSERWLLVDLLPGAQPLEELEAVLLRIAHNPPETLLNQLREDQRGLIRAVKRVLPPDETVELVLLIDQFEEVFTLVADEGARVQFLLSMHAAVTDPRSRVRVIVTLRADFYDRPLLYPDPGALLRARTEVVLPLTGEELEQAIAGPASRAGLVLEPRLVAEIVQDVGEQPGTLPLLQYALTELFGRRQGRTLTLAAYRESGGVRGALARRADEIYTTLDASGREAARQLFLRLITLGEGAEDTRRRVLRRELTALTTDDRPPITDSEQDTETRKHGELATANLLVSTSPDLPVSHSPVVGRRSSVVDDVIDAYGGARLLSFDHDPITRAPTVEVAHEALLREWGRLRGWLQESREALRTQRRLTRSAAEWVATGRERSYLATGVRLTQFSALAEAGGLALNQDERAYLDASQAQAEQEAAEREAQRQRELEQARALAEERTAAARRLRRRALLLAGALALALVAALTAGIFARNAQDNFVRSELLRLAGEANSALDRGESGELPALLAIRSLHNSENPQAIDALRRALARPFSLQRFIGHTDAIYEVAFSRDGKQALTAGADETVRLWDVATGQELQRCECSTSSVISVAFSPDGKHVLTGSDYGTVRLWDIATGHELRQFEGHFGAVSSVQFSADGKQILTGSRDLTARLWDATTGQELRQFRGHDDAVWAAVFSPDGKLVLTGSADHTARLWDVATGHELRQFAGHIDGIPSVAFSPDGTQAVTAGNDKTARLWNVQTGQQLRRFEGHTDAVLRVTFSPDGQYVLTSGADHTARLWVVASGQQLRVFVGHTDAVNGVAFSPDGQQVLTGSADKTARLWDTLAVTEPRAFIGHTGEVSAVAFSPDGKQVLTGSADHTALLWDAQTGRQARLFEGHTNRILSVAFSPDGTQAATASDDYTARLWNVQSGELLRVFSHGDSVMSTVFSPNGRYLFIGIFVGTVRMWDLTTSREVRRFDHPSRVVSMALSPDGRYLLTGSNDQIARLWDVASGQELRSFLGHSGCICGVAFSPDGTYVLTGSGDKTARLWETQTGQQLRVFNGHTGEIGTVAFSPDSKYVLTGSGDKTARLWDAATGEQRRIFRGQTGTVFGVAFSPDGKQVLIGSEDNIARLWTLNDQDIIQRACATLSRDFTPEERAQYGIADDAPTCPAR